MVNPVFEFLERHSSFIITTHENPDPDGLGAEKVFSQIAASMGKKARIVNSDPVLGKFSFIDHDNSIEIWGNLSEPLPKDAALVILDTANENNIGDLREFLACTPEVFVIDHHELGKQSMQNGYVDPLASSTCELMVELAQQAGVTLSAGNAVAAYTGIVYDTGFFAYSKTTIRTFKAALALVESGVKPYEVYRSLVENASSTVLELQKKVLSSLKIYNKGRIAVQFLRKADLESCNANPEDSENFINIPMKSKEVEVSVFVKENKEGKVRCSLRSKGGVNVSKIAQSLGGGGHVCAAGFKSPNNIKETLALVLKKINEELD